MRGGNPYSPPPIHPNWAKFGYHKLAKSIRGHQKHFLQGFLKEISADSKLYLHMSSFGYPVEHMPSMSQFMLDISYTIVGTIWIQYGYMYIYIYIYV